MKKFVFILILLASANASADQCAWNDLTIASRGVKLIKALAEMNNQDPSVYLFCQPCGDSEMRRVHIDQDNSNIAGLDVTYKYVKVPVTTNNRTYWEVTLNSKSENPFRVDLAYVYVKTAANVFANVATLVNCPVQDVPSVLYLGELRR